MCYSPTVKGCEEGQAQRWQGLTGNAVYRDVYSF